MKDRVNHFYSLKEMFLSLLGDCGVKDLLEWLVKLNKDRLEGYRLPGGVHNSKQLFGNKKVKPEFMDCYSCGDTFAFTTDNFYRHVNYVFGLNRVCKRCHNKQQSIRRIRKTANDYTTNNHFQCNGCNEICIDNVDDENGVIVVKHNKFLLKGKPYCKVCYDKYIIERQEEENSKPTFLMCYRCRNTYRFNTENFNQSITAKWGLRKLCKKCASEDSLKSYHKNKKKKDREIKVKR